MHVTRHTEFSTLLPWRAAWNVLAREVPFRRWDWIEPWWRHYGCLNDGRPRRGYELNTLAVWTDDKTLVGIAPWYRIHHRSGARVIQFLGDGEVCSDHLTVLCQQEHEDRVAIAIAEFLCGDADAMALNNSWDRMEFSGVQKDDAVVGKLLEQLQLRGATLHLCPAPNSWRIRLPESWEEYLRQLSKAHRNRLRRAERACLRTDRLLVHHLQNLRDLPTFFDILVDLHQRRWKSRGLPGCFASHQFVAFHRDVCHRLFGAGRAALCWLELDGVPLAAEYRLQGDGIVYAYQSGIDPNRLNVSPGELANMFSIQQAIAEGYREYDYLRGDEPYKAHWRAQPRPMLAVRVVPPRISAQLRHSAWRAGQQAKEWIKNSAKFTRKLIPSSKART